MLDDQDVPVPRIVGGNRRGGINQNGPNPGLTIRSREAIRNLSGPNYWISLGSVELWLGSWRG